MQVLKDKDIPFEQEIYRKLIHLLSLSMPIIYIFISKELAIMILLPIALFDFIVELLYRKYAPVKNIVNMIFGKMLRQHEKEEKLVFTGATWVFISAILTIIIFPKFIAITALTILIVSDISAALIGRKFGRHKFLGKSIEGTLAFIISACTVIMIYGIIFNAPWTYFFFGFFSAIIGAFFEVISRIIKIDDNLSIPLSIAFFLWIVDAIHLFSNITYSSIL